MSGKPIATPNAVTVPLVVAIGVAACTLVIFVPMPWAGLGALVSIGLLLAIPPANWFVPCTLFGVGMPMLYLLPAVRPSSNPEYDWKFSLCGMLIGAGIGVMADAAVETIREQKRENRASRQTPHGPSGKRQTR